MKLTGSLSLGGYFPWTFWLHFNFFLLRNFSWTYSSLIFFSITSTTKIMICNCLNISLYFPNGWSSLDFPNLLRNDPGVISCTYDFLEEFSIEEFIDTSIELCIMRHYLFFYNYGLNISKLFEKNLGCYDYIREVISIDASSYSSITTLIYRSLLLIPSHSLHFLVIWLCMYFYVFFLSEVKVVV